MFQLENLYESSSSLFDPEEKQCPTMKWNTTETKEEGDRNGSIQCHRPWILLQQRKDRQEHLRRDILLYCLFVFDKENSLVEDFEVKGRFHVLSMVHHWNKLAKEENFFPMFDEKETRRWQLMETIDEQRFPKSLGFLPQRKEKHFSSYFQCVTSHNDRLFDFPTFFR